MKPLVTGCIVAALLAFTPSIFAQDHDSGEVGAFAEYFHLKETGSNFAGLGARVGGNLGSYVQLEGQMGYDFARTFTASTSDAVGATLIRSRLTLLHGLFGPKFEAGTAHARVFGTVQGGFIRFGVSNGTGTVINGFTTSVSDVGDGGTHGALYPGVGTELYVGHVGLRLDVGDFIYWNNGTHNNWDVRLGPQIRF